MDAWDTLGTGYPGGEKKAQIVFNVLAPVLDFMPKRCPIYELGHEETPRPDEVWVLAEKIVEALEKAHA
jgi:hypothetical protein